MYKIFNKNMDAVVISKFLLIFISPGAAPGVVDLLPESPPPSELEAGDVSPSTS